MSTDKERLYQERLNRLDKTMNLEPVDRILSVYMGIAPAAVNMGMTLAKYIEDIDAACEVTLDYMDKLQTFDGINLHPPTRITILLTMLWLSRVKVPGRELPENMLWQVEEKNVMTESDYDLIIDKGFGAFQAQHLPKVADMAEMQMGQQYMGEKSAINIGKFRERGYINVACGLTTIPFEFLCGARSMTQFFFDCYRMPDKVKAAMDVMVPDLIDLALMQTGLMGVNGIWVGGWRAASALLAPKIWDDLVFPYYYKIITALVEKGVIPVLHWDQDWTRDLARLKEFPARKCIFNPDGMTDLRKFKEVLGDHMAVMGDVPSSLFAVGTPEDIRNYVRDLVRDVGPSGLILCPGCDAPANTRPENMEAFAAACEEFGSA